ncbi:MAG TPA: LamG domain-containing protein [Firmicutes bacterium]|nr:LamG domain-containing protein [Bacillota bacterium]
MKKFSFVLALVSVLLLSLSVVSANTVVHWRFTGEEGERPEVLENSYGIPAYVVQLEPTGVYYVDDALYFDNPTATNNDGSFLYCLDTDPLDLAGWQGLTFEVIFNPSTIRQCVLLRKTEGTSNNGYQLVITNNGSLAFFLGSSMGSKYAVTDAGAVVPGQWYHVAATWDGDRMRIFLDGVEVANTLYLDELEHTSGHLGIGALVRTTALDNIGQYFHGYIREIRISDRALDPSEFLK